jgi:hypothetical protein
LLIIALVLAVIGLAALVTAVVTSNEVIAWVCIGASVIGVLLLIVDALRERSRGARGGDADETDEQTAVLAASAPAEDYPDEPTSQFSQVTDDTDTAEYPDDVSYPDESDTTAVAVDDGEPVDAPSDADDSTKRD